MQVKLSSIKSSPQPVRTSHDEQKLVELVESIRQHELLQAVKVRPVGDMYEVVFGHRRVEACRRLGLETIRAVVEKLDDSTTLVQALIENVVREDLGALDKARALKVLQDETGWSTREITAQGFMSQSHIVKLLKLLEEPEEIQQMLRTPASDSPGITLSSITERHVRAVRPVGLTKHDRITVLRKAAREDLTAAQTRDVADAFKRIENDRIAKENLAALPLVRSRETLDALVGYRKEKAEKKEAKVYDHLDDLNVKGFADAISAATTSIRAQWLLVDKNLIGAEHMPYLAKRLRRLAGELNSKADKLEKQRKGEVDA